MGTLNDLEYKYWLSVLDGGTGFSGDYDDLTNKPDLKQGAFHDVGDVNANDLITKSILESYITTLEGEVTTLTNDLQALSARVDALENPPIEP